MSTPTVTDHATIDSSLDTDQITGIEEEEEEEACGVVVADTAAGGSRPRLEPESIDADVGRLSDEEPPTCDCCCCCVVVAAVVVVRATASRLPGK